MPNVIVELVLIVSIFLLLASVWNIGRIRRIVVHVSLRTSWVSLGAMLFLAVCGCLTFLYTNATEGSEHHEDWLIAFTLLAASLFVFGVCIVSLFTSRELSRIDDLEKAAFFDPLTALYTRGHIDSLLKVECEQSNARVSQLAVILLDIDNFKSINDFFGHRVGDYVLKEVGRILEHACDRRQMVGRYGGEEFLIVSPNTPPAAAVRMAERVRSRVADARLSFDDAAIHVTVSIGVMVNFTFCETAMDLVSAADTAMYEAKRRGRNQVALGDERPNLSKSSQGRNGVHAGDKTAFI
jgi:diguanylate cyclase (GGDEF)-like protein